LENSKIQEYGLNSRNSSITDSNMKNSLISEKSNLRMKKMELQKEIDRLKTKLDLNRSLNNSVCSKNSSK